MQDQVRENIDPCEIGKWTRETEMMDETEAEAWRAVEEGGVRKEEEVQREVPEVVPKKRVRK